MRRTTQSCGCDSHPQAQSHGLAQKASTSCGFLKTRLTTSKTSQAFFKSWGISRIGSMPRSTKAPEICMTCSDSYMASSECAPSIMSMHVQVMSSSADGSHPFGGCGPRSNSSASIASHTSRSVSCWL
jgi:hypothetical protein